MNDPQVHPVSPLGRLKLAVTVDDMTLFRGWPYKPGDGSVRVTNAFIQAFASHRIPGVYQFSNTAPLQTNPELEKVYELWVEQGHHVGNHTHNHPCINWLDADKYTQDIELAEKYIGRYINAAPRRCFRFCMDMWGDTECKCAAVLDSLQKMAYTPVPISVGFMDTRWNAVYCRTAKRGSAEELAWLRDRYIDVAVHELRVHAANARAVFGRDPAHIWMLHGTSIAADCLERILERFCEAGVDFVSLDEAMADPMNAQVPPRVSPEFIHQVEKWALVRNVPVNDRPPRILQEIERMHPAPGESAEDDMQTYRRFIVENTGAVLAPIPLSSDQQS